MASETPTLRDRDKKGFFYYLKWAVMLAILYLALSGPVAMLKAKGSIPPAAAQAVDITFGPVNWLAHLPNPGSAILLKYINWCAAPPKPPAKS